MPAQVGARDPLEVVLEPRDDREDHAVHDLTEQLRRHRRELVGVLVGTEAGRAHPTTHDRVVAVQRHEVEPAGRGHATGVDDEVTRLGAPRAQRARMRTPGHQDAGEEQGLGDLGDHDRPHAESAHGEHHADECEPEEVGDGLGDRDRLEVEVPLQEGHRHDRGTLDREHEREPAHHRLEMGLAEVVGGEGRAQEHEHGHHEPGEHREGEGAPDVLVREPLPLDHGGAEARLREELAQGDHDQRRGHDTVVGLGQVAREHDDDEELADTLRAEPQARPHHPAQGVPGGPPGLRG